MDLFFGKYDSFRRSFAQSTGCAWQLDKYKELQTGRGWRIQMQGQTDWWLVTDDPSVTPGSTRAVYVVRWGAARLRAWRCTGDHPTRSGNVLAFPNAIPRRVDRMTKGPWRNRLRVVK